jgi:hypothetical protein
VHRRALHTSFPREAAKGRRCLLKSARRILLSISLVLACFKELAQDALLRAQDVFGRLFFHSPGARRCDWATINSRSSCTLCTRVFAQRRVEPKTTDLKDWLKDHRKAARALPLPIRGFPTLNAGVANFSNARICAHAANAFAEYTR